jgi:cytoskeleton protein RodZ
MTSKQSTAAESGSHEPGLTDTTPANVPAVAPMPSLGQRLRAAREARGQDLDACAQTLRLPVRVLRQLEADDHGGIDYQVYLAGYIAKYARHLGLDDVDVQAEMERLKPRQPALVASGGISHSRYLLERYATAATYVVLTAVIVVPMVWLGVRGTLDRDMAHLAPLDAAPVARQDAPAHAASATDGASVAASGSVQMPAPTIQPPQAEEQPLLASMAPFPTSFNGSGEAAQPAVAPAPAASAAAGAQPGDVVGTGAHSVALNLTGASWVEVTAADGSRLQYGLLPAGASKTWRSDQPLEVRIGNAGGAQVSVDGQPVALDGYRHANVAHFRIAIENGKATPSGA